MHGAVLVAGGQGRRMNDRVEDKLLHPILDTNAFRLSCQAYLQADKISSMVIVFRDEKQKEKLTLEYEKATQELGSCISPTFVKGGDERKDSVLGGLLALPNECDYVQVHDCARPLIRSLTIEQMASEVARQGALVACRPAQDTIRQDLEPLVASDQPRTTKTMDRSTLWLMETPQSSRKDWLIEGLRIAKEKNLCMTDEISALEIIGKKTAFFELEYPNPKITNFEDFKLVEYLLGA